MKDDHLFKISEGVFNYGKNIFFDNLSFTLGQGQFYGLIGPNGSGKSTLIDLLMGTRSLLSGMIEYKTQPLQSYKRKELARHLALVPQHIAIGFDFTVYDIVMMGRHPHIPRFSSPSEHDLSMVHSVLRLLDIEHLRERPVTHLSGGEKQRVIVARALAQETTTIMLDEATSNLDIEHTIEIMRVLRKKVNESGTTVIAAVHDLNLAAAFCDELIVLKNGTVHEKGPVKTVLTADLLRRVFSVNGTVFKNQQYPRIEYEMRSPSAASL
ncbi:ABC transporter ATP-binding protein [Desulfopila inferna]|uniref:ABC transporter ATP-binding protein n=1 Tax=Desulfopila inferna TaxID=468528 RepID=UPI001963DE33|nr:ABC transporter ATP-binding protein [Desulfopila inferna]MBM9602649.1 ABC transporter ATP-binding protein [Desulfopila inferna]